MPFLQMAYTDRSGTSHPDAIFEVIGLHLELTRDSIGGDVQLSIFHDLVTHDAGRDPFEERPPSPLTPAEIAALEDQFRLAVYQVLQQRQEFLGATVLM